MSDSRIVCWTYLFLSEIFRLIGELISRVKHNLRQMVWLYHKMDLCEGSVMFENICVVLIATTRLKNLRFVVFFYNYVKYVAIIIIGI